MKKIILILLVVGFWSCHSNKKISDSNKSFEGKIIYDMKFMDKTGEMTPEQSQMIMGNEQVYWIKRNKYKSEMNGMMKMVQYYLGGDTLYNKMNGVNSLLWINATVNPEKMKDYKIEKNAETVAGINCDLLTIISEDGVDKYFYNKKYNVNPEDFENHEYGFWKFYIEKTKALPIKSISDKKDYYIEITAREITKMPVDDIKFTLPDLPRAKMPLE